MATHPSIPAWKIPWREDSGGLHTVRCGDQKELDKAERLTV